MPPDRVVVVVVVMGLGAAGVATVTATAACDDFFTLLFRDAADGLRMYFDFVFFVEGGGAIGVLFVWSVASSVAIAMAVAMAVAVA